MAHQHDPFFVDRAFYITIAALIKSIHLHTMASFHYFRNEELAIAKLSKLIHRMRKREKQLLFLNDDSSMKFILLTILALLYPVGW